MRGYNAAPVSPRGSIGFMHPVDSAFGRNSGCYPYQQQQTSYAINGASYNPMGVSTPGFAPPVATLPISATAGVVAGGSYIVQPPGNAFGMMDGYPYQQQHGYYPNQQQQQQHGYYPYPYPYQQQQQQHGYYPYQQQFPYYNPSGQHPEIPYANGAVTPLNSSGLDNYNTGVNSVPFGQFGGQQHHHEGDTIYHASHENSRFEQQPLHSAAFDELNNSSQVATPSPIKPAQQSKEHAAAVDTTNMTVEERRLHEDIEKLQRENDDLSKSTAEKQKELERQLRHIEEEERQREKEQRLLEEIEEKQRQQQQNIKQHSGGVGELFNPYADQHHDNRHQIIPDGYGGQLPAVANGSSNIDQQHQMNNIANPYASSSAQQQRLPESPQYPEAPPNTPGEKNGPTFLQHQSRGLASLPERQSSKRSPDGEIVKGEIERLRNENNNLKKTTEDKQRELEKQKDRIKDDEDREKQREHEMQQLQQTYDRELQQSLQRERHELLQRQQREQEDQRRQMEGQRQQLAEIEKKKRDLDKERKEYEQTREAVKQQQEEQQRYQTSNNNNNTPQKLLLDSSSSSPKKGGCWPKREAAQKPQAPTSTGARPTATGGR